MRAVLHVCQILNVKANEQQNDAFHEIRLFSLFPAKSDMLWYDLRGIRLPWSVPREYCHYHLHISGPSSNRCTTISLVKSVSKWL